MARILSVRFKLTYYTLGESTTLLTHQQSLACEIAGASALHPHEIILVDKRFRAPTLTAADDLAWTYRRSPQFIIDVHDAAVAAGLPDPGLPDNRELYFYDVVNVVIK